MGTWNVEPEEGVINNRDGSFTFSKNTGDDKQYTIKYNSDECGTIEKKVTVPGCGCKSGFTAVISPTDCVNFIPLATVGHCESGSSTPYIITGECKDCNGNYVKPEYYFPSINKEYWDNIEYFHEEDTTTYELRITFSGCHKDDREQTNALFVIRHREDGSAFKTFLFKLCETT